MIVTAKLHGAVLCNLHVDSSLMLSNSISMFGIIGSHPFITQEQIVHTNDFMRWFSPLD